MPTVTYRPTVPLQATDVHPLANTQGMPAAQQNQNSGTLAGSAQLPGVVAPPIVQQVANPPPAPSNTPADDPYRALRSAAGAALGGIGWGTAEVPPAAQLPPPGTLAPLPQQQPPPFQQQHVDEEQWHEATDDDIPEGQVESEEGTLRDWAESIFGSFVAVVLSTFMTFVFALTGQFAPAAIAGSMTVGSFYVWCERATARLIKVTTGTMVVASSAAFQTGSGVIGVVAALLLCISLAQAYLSGTLFTEAADASGSRPGSRPPSRPSSAPPTPRTANRLEQERLQKQLAELQAKCRILGAQELAAAGLPIPPVLQAGLPAVPPIPQITPPVVPPPAVPPIGAGILEGLQHFQTGGPAMGPYTASGAAAGLPGALPTGALVHGHPALPPLGAPSISPPPPGMPGVPPPQPPPLVG